MQIPHIFANLPAGNVKASLLDDNFQAVQLYQPAGTGATPVPITTELDVTLKATTQPVMDAMNTVFGMHHTCQSVLLLGDSIWGSGVGATTQAQGTPYMVARSLANSIERGEKLEVGHRYHVQLNAYPNGGAWTEQGVSTAGGVAPKANVLTNWCYNVPAGGQLILSGRQMCSADVFYDAAASSTGTMTVALNGVTVTTKPITAGTGVVNTYTQAGVPAWLRPLEQFAPCAYEDVITLTFSTACTIKGIITPRTFPATSSHLSPFIFTAGKEGGMLSQLQTASIFDEIAAYLNFNELTGAGGEKLLVIGFGINDIYLGRYAPATMVSYLSALVTAIQNRCSNVTFAYIVPYDGDPARLSGIGFTYPPAYPFVDYVNALAAFCTANNIAVLRADRLVPNPALLVDGVHPPASIHRRLAGSYAAMLGTPVNPELTTITLGPAYDSTQPTVADVTYTSTWRAYTGVSTYSMRAHKRGTRIDLSGLIEPNGSVSTTVCTLPVGYRPIGRTIFIQAQTTAAGASVLLTIGTNGVVVTSGIPASGVLVLDGLGFEMSLTS